MNNEDTTINVYFPGSAIPTTITRREAKNLLKNLGRELAQKPKEWRLVQYHNGQPMKDSKGKLILIDNDSLSVAKYVGVWDKNGYGLSVNLSSRFDIRWEQVEVS